MVFARNSLFQFTCDEPPSQPPILRWRTFGQPTQEHFWVGAEEILKSDLSVGCKLNRLDHVRVELGHSAMIFLADHFVHEVDVETVTHHLIPFLKPVSLTHILCCFRRQPRD